MGPHLKALTGKQQTFAQVYGTAIASGKKITQAHAAIEAGYSEAGAHVHACRMLKDSKIIAAVHEVQDEIYAKDIMSAVEMQQRQSRMSRFDPMDFINDEGEINIADIRESGMIIAGIEVEEIELTTEDGPVIIKRKYKIKGEALRAMEGLAKLRNYNEEKAGDGTMHIVVKSPHVTSEKTEAESGDTE